MKQETMKEWIFQLLLMIQTLEKARSVNGLNAYEVEALTLLQDAKTALHCSITERDKGLRIDSWLADNLKAPGL